MGEVKQEHPAVRSYPTHFVLGEALARVPLDAKAPAAHSSPTPTAAGVSPSGRRPAFGGEEKPTKAQLRSAKASAKLALVSAEH